MGNSKNSPLLVFCRVGKRLHRLPTRCEIRETAWAERVLLGIYPLTPKGGKNLFEAAAAYSLRVQQRAHPTLRDIRKKA